MRLIQRQMQVSDVRSEDADKIIVMDNGEINGIGTHEELLKNNEIYSEVYNSQVKGGGDDE